MSTFTSETASAGRDQICAFCSEPSDAFHTAFIGENSQLRVRLASGDTYDANNLRVMTQDAGGTKRILLDGMEEMAEYASGANTVRYDHDPSKIDMLLGQRGDSTKVYAITDTLGTLHQLTDSASASESRYGYDAFGERTSISENVGTKIGFTGRVQEPSSQGSVYSRLRYLDTRSGRWISPDPWRFAEGPNRYGYVRNAVTNTRDPSGLLAEVYCRYLSKPQGIAQWANLRHCGVRLRCEFGKDTCSPAMRPPSGMTDGILLGGIRDSFWELLSKNLLTGSTEYLQHDWQGPLLTGTDPSNPLQKEEAFALPGFVLALLTREWA